MAGSPEERPTILIVDDEPHVRSVLRRTLRKEGYRLVFAESGADALKMLLPERPDVILSDYLMPEMTGLEFFKKCCLAFPHAGRVLLTGQAELQTVIQAINDGEIFRFLLKPWDDDDLKLTLHLAIERSRLERENYGLRAEVRRQTAYIRQLERALAGKAGKPSSGTIVISEEELASLSTGS